VWRQLKWLLPLVFCWSDPDVPRWDLGAVTSESCSAIVGLTNGSGLVARVNQHNGFPVMRSLTGGIKPISRDRWSDLCIRSHIVSVEASDSVGGCFTTGTPDFLRVISARDRKAHSLALSPGRRVQVRKRACSHVYTAASLICSKVARPSPLRQRNRAQGHKRMKISVYILIRFPS
jgi:hypothetical protein